MWLVKNPTVHYIWALMVNGEEKQVEAKQCGTFNWNFTISLNTMEGI
jgi:hypothetical protein